MDLDLTDDQHVVADLFDTFFAAESPSSLVRETEALGHSPELWAALVATGAPTMATSEAHGGGGAGLLESVLAVEAAGRSLAPVPLVEHMVAARAFEAVGHRPGPPDGAPVSIALHAVADDGRTARLAPAGAVAAQLLVRCGDRLCVVATDPPGVAAPNGAGLPIADRDVVDAESLAVGPEAADVHSRAVDEWRLLTAARLVGLTEAALAAGVAYVSEREQFGVPIGSFQAIQHGLAELAGPLAGARLLVRRAAWRVDAEPGSTLPVDAVMALSFATRLARTTTGRVLHYHGGYGVMDEYDPQLYHRRAQGWPAQLGDPDEELGLLGDRLYAPDLDAPDLDAPDDRPTAAAR